MKRRPAALALVHHPVRDRRGDRVTTAVTNLDLHDIARAARTYDIGRFYVATPALEQQRLVDRILRHWREGYGADYNPHRGEALSLVETVSSLEEALVRWGEATEEEPLPVLTGASVQGGISFRRCRELACERPLLLVFGTGWGLDPALFEKGWPALVPLRGIGSYNHLSVRAAAAVVLDRLFGDNEDVEPAGGAAGTDENENGSTDRDFR